MVARRETELTDLDTAQDGPRPADVVEVVVAEDHRVDAPAVRSKQVRENDALARVESLAGASGRIDQQAVARSTPDGDRLGLPDVDHRRFDRTGDRPGPRTCMQGENAHGEAKRRDASEPPP